MNQATDKLALLRKAMKEKNTDVYIIENSDPHQTEYLPDHWQIIRWICGFKGEVATLIITQEEALLWTDSRFFISGAAQLEGSSVSLMKLKVPGVPSIQEWLDHYCSTHISAVISGDKRVIFGEAIDYVSQDLDLITALWKDRPSLPMNPVEIYPEEWSGELTSDRLKRVREQCRMTKDSCLFISALDEIVWVLNLRGSDVLCTPAFVAYLLITADGGCLYINRSKISAEVENYLKGLNIMIKPYEEGSCAVAQSGLEPCPNPIQLMKAIKNETEIAGFRSAMLKDGIALTQFYYWLEQELQSGATVTEMDCVRKLAYYHSLQPQYRGESFPAIVGWNGHASMPHYEPSDEHDTSITGDGLLLIDAGCQFLDGTTDMTRTIGIGNVSAAMKRDYTLVLKGHIRLATAAFPVGTRGDQVDAFARLDLWRDAKTYRHGTGHGVGHFLGCHEGPQSIRMEHNPQVLLAGMVMSNEPAIYLGGKYGIRHENMILIRPLIPETDAPEATPCDRSEHGDFLCFETLTLCYLDTSCLDLAILNQEEKDWINQYNQRVYTEINSYLSPDIRCWLADKCKAIE